MCFALLYYIIIQLVFISFLFMSENIKKQYKNNLYKAHLKDKHN